MLFAFLTKSTTILIVFMTLSVSLASSVEPTSNVIEDTNEYEYDSIAYSLIERTRHPFISVSSPSLDELADMSKVYTLRIGVANAYEDVIVDSPRRRQQQKTLKFVLNNDSNVFLFPLVSNANNSRPLSLNYGELEEDLVEVCFKLINSTNLTRATKLKPLSEFCNENFYDRLIRLDLSSNKLADYPTELLDRWFSALEDLVLANNSIEAMRPNFGSVHLSRARLKRLDLSLNRLERLDQEAFKSLSALESLNLSMNQLKTVNLFAFASDTHSLVKLDLSHNLITDHSIEFLLFSSFVNLKSLNLNYNRLATLSNHLFYNLYNLEYLSLSHNNLKAFDLINFNNNDLLKVLDLSYNLNLRLDKPTSRLSSSSDDDLPIVNPAASTPNSTLELLSLAGVDLAHISGLFLESIVERFSKLRVLNLTSTRLKSLSAVQKWPSTIEVIDLSFNFLRDGQFECNQLSRLVKLSKVYLKSNKFKSFEAFLSSCSFWLNRSVHFDLRHNSFESLDGLASMNSDSLSCQFSPSMICDCDENTWWSKIDTVSTKFQVARPPHVNSKSSSLSHNHHYNTHESSYCVLITDYERLECRSISDAKLSMLKLSWPSTNTTTSSILLGLDEPELLLQPQFFTPIDRRGIAPELVCPYAYTCATRTCECCEFRACDCAFYCPTGCKCTRDFMGTFDRVNCTNNGSGGGTMSFPTSATEIVLGGNQIKRLQPFQFFGRHRLERIDLTRNSLAFIEENSFDGLPHLRTLLLSHNELQILLGYEFKGLVELEYLHLEYNRIQFVSNATFTTLVRLQYLNLMGNPLRHLMEMRVYFEFNVNLVNLSIDSSVVESVATDAVAAAGDIKQQHVLTSNSVSMTPKRRKLVAAASSKSISDVSLSPIQYVEHIRNLLLNAKYSSELIDCIIAKFKQVIDIELKHNRTLRTISNSKPFEKLHWLKEFLSQRLRSFKMSCKSSLFGASSSFTEPKSLSLTQTSGDDDYDLLKSPSLLSSSDSTNNEDDDKPLSSLSQHQQHQQPSPPPQQQIVLNYNTIGICILVLVGLIGLFSIVFAYLLNRLQCAVKSATAATVSHNNGSSSDLAAKNSKSLRFRRFIRSIKRRFFKLVNRRSLDGELTYQKGRNRRVTSTLTSSSSHSLAYGVSTCTLPIYDLFLVYNKLDANLVHKMIAPILRSKPYNFRLALEHGISDDDTAVASAELLDEDDNNNDDDYANSRKASSSSLGINSSDGSSSSSSNNNNRSSERLQLLVRQSSFVLFILTENLLTGVEYELAAHTCAAKRLAMLADEQVTEATAHKLVQPSRVLKATFDVPMPSATATTTSRCRRFYFRSSPPSSSSTDDSVSVATTTTGRSETTTTAAVAKMSTRSSCSSSNKSSGRCSSEEMFDEEINEEASSATFHKKMQLFNKFEF